MENFKYLGILKDFDFDTENVDKNTFMFLIEKGIVCFDYDLTGEDLEEDNAYYLQYPNQTFSLNAIGFVFYGKSYCYNKIIFEEMEEKDNEKIVYYSDAEKIILEIDYELEKLLSKNSKTELIEKYYSKYFSLIKNDVSNYLLYINKTASYGYNCWNDIYTDNLHGSGNYQSLIDYLKGKIYFFNPVMKEEWELIYKVSNVCAFCKSKMNEMQNSTANSIITIPVAEQQIFEVEFKNKWELIFKDDGYNIFNFLITKYSGKKNKAFFSYIYHFLRKEKKLIRDINDNKEYRIFIEELFQLKMSRIIMTVSGNHTSKDFMYETFENYMKSYSVD